MTRVLVDRLAIPATMACLLVLALAYWWLDNLPHELFGTALFALLIRHLVVNWSWFRNLGRGRYDTRRRGILVLHAILIVNMIVLLVTSLVISQSVFAWQPLPNIAHLREIHWFSAYWVIVIVGLHIGLHWRRIMAFVPTSLRLKGSCWGEVSLRLLTALLAIYGAWSFAVLGVWTKLTFTYSLEFWDFTSSVSPFFAHWTGVIGLFAVIGHCVARLLKRHPRSPAATRFHRREGVQEWTS